MNTGMIYDVEVDGIDPADYPDFCDAFICCATWGDGRPLTEVELDELNENSDFVQEQVIKHLF